MKVSRVRIRELHSSGDMRQVERLQSILWPGSQRDVVPSHFLLAVAHNGGLVIGAFEGDRLVGFVVGFLGTEAGGPKKVANARLKHCSHLLGVHPDYQGVGLGYLLKLAQRRAIIEQGLRLVTWTYDPLISLEAHLNIRRLGAISWGYLRDAFGRGPSDPEASVPSDRVSVDWWVSSTRVKARVEVARAPLDLAHYLSAGAQKLNPATLSPSGLPHPAETPESPTGMLALVEIPPDYPALLARDIDLARTWRFHMRAILEGAFASGYILTDFIHLKGERFPRSYYVLSQGEATLG